MTSAGSGTPADTTGRPDVPVEPPRIPAQRRRRDAYTLYAEIYALRLDGVESRPRDEEHGSDHG